MRDYVELVKSLRLCAKGHCESGCMCFRADLPFAGCTIDQDEDDLKLFAADAIEELLAFAKFVARQAIDTGDNDGVSAEILCRKLNKLGLIETDGEFWMLPTPPKEVE